MGTVKPVHIPTLLELLLLGARSRPIQISTIALAKRIGRSQQAASKHLVELERDGLIERTRIGNLHGIKLTQSGVDAMTALYGSLKTALEERPQTVEVKGYLFSGLGEGAYYVSLRGYRRQFIAKLGFDPYPGTFNVRLASALDRKTRRELQQYPGVFISGFEDEHRTFGWVRCLPAAVNGAVEGYVLSAFERTHYDDSVIEVIAPTRIRDWLGLKDGDLVSIQVTLSREMVAAPRTAS